jgi:hypothetical protein
MNVSTSLDMTLNSVSSSGVENGMNVSTSLDMTSDFEPMCRNQHDV